MYMFAFCVTLSIRACILLYVYVLIKSIQFNTFTVSYHIAEKFRRRIFCDLVLKLTFRGNNFTICVLIFCACALISTIS